MNIGSPVGPGARLRVAVVVFMSVQLSLVACVN